MAQLVAHFMTRAILSAMVLIAAFPGIARGQPCGTMQDLGTLPGGSHSHAYGVTADGSVVVGQAYSAADQVRPFRWTAPGGMQDLGTLIGGSDGGAYCASADGRVIAGIAQNADGHYRAFRWTASGGMQDLSTLGGQHSTAYAVSADGGVIVGYAHNEAGVWRAFRWTASDGMHDLGTLGGIWGAAYGASADGSVIVGEAQNTEILHRAFRWTASNGMQDLGTLGGQYSTASGVSADGSVVVGYAQNVANVWRAFRWTASSGMQDLGTLGGSSSEAYGISADGSVIVGATQNVAGNYRAFYWTASDGMQDLGTLGGLDSYANSISADGAVVVGYAHKVADEYRAFRWQGASLQFRESDNGSWTWGPDGIPGWDHVGLFYNGRVYESHPEYPTCSSGYWDPTTQQFVTILPDDGVQWQHTLGSYQHDSCTTTSTAGNLSIGVPCDNAADMVSFIETQSAKQFLYICPSSLDLPCLRDTLNPSKQKGITGDQYTCVGLVERAAEEAGLNGGEGFIPNKSESFYVPFFGEVPCLSPMVLSWFAEEGFNFSNGGALCGLFDPVDFVLTDPLGRRLGHTEALGTLNEIPGALYTGNGVLEQFLIANPIAGQYQLQLVGLGGQAGAAIGGSVDGQIFEGNLAAGETHDIAVVVYCPSDFTKDGFVTGDDFDAFVTEFIAGNAPADFNGDGFVTGDDFDAFVVAFIAGC